MSKELVPVPEKPTSVDLPLGYYERLRDGHDLRRGDLVYMTGREGDRVNFVRGESQWSMDAATFAETYVIAPDGLVRRQAEIVAVLTDIAGLSAEDVSAEALAGYNPHVDATGAVEGMSLVPTGGASAEAAKRQVAVIRNAAAKKRNELAARQAEIAAFAKEQAMIMRAKASELQELVAKAEEAVWTINLYLGTNEQIVRLVDGAPAPADTPITVRQLVLFMDEELAANAEAGGMDFKNIDWFDEWVADPAHLAQVLPELRGIVALKPRRKAKDYNTDPWANAQMNKENRRTYFLIRNGGLLYRMWTDYDVADHLVPRTDEFLKTFVGRRVRRHGDPGTFAGDYEDETYQMEPGSAEFMRAEKAADSTRRHYMRAALVLQGLIDRTTVFAPLKWQQVNVNSIEAYDEAINLVLDGDVVLGDGRERFRDWLTRVNATLEVGCRVVGTWGNWEHGLRLENDEHYGNSRLSPRRADMPHGDALYTIDGRREGGFRFLYPRYDYRGRQMATRASCLVFPTDRFLLNFDAATVEEMRFFLTSRADRTEYLYMYPLLRYALEQKALEAEAEAPFRLLLAGEIAKTHGVDVATATEAVDELVTWWKFKNRNHRAIAADDAKAVRMIVAEYGLRTSRAADLAERPETAEVVAAILAAHPDALLIAHKAYSEYVALIPANDRNVFVHEEVWTKRLGLRRRKEWRTVDKRHLGWRVLTVSQRWETWLIGAVAREHLTDPERDQFLADAWDRVRAPRHGWEGFGAEDELPTTVRRLATCYREGNAELYYWTGPRPIPTENLLTSRRRVEPDLRLATFGWRRTASGAIVSERRDEHGLSVGDRYLPWETTFHGQPYGGEVLSVDASSVRDYRRAYAAGQDHAKRRSALQERVWRARDAVEKQVAAGWLAAEHVKFLADYGDPELWEGHLKTLKQPQANAHQIDGLLEYLIERHVTVAGRTVAELAADARERGWFGEAPDELADYHA